MYLNFAARTNAGLWLEAADAAAKASRGQQQSETRGWTDCAGDDADREGGAKRQKIDRPAVLLEADIDWDAPRPAHEPNMAPEQPSAESPPNDSSAAEDQIRKQAAPEGPCSRIASAKISLAPLDSTQLDDRDRAHQPATFEEASESSAPDLTSAPSAEGLEDYSPSRHGGESPHADLLPFLSVGRPP